MSPVKTLGIYKSQDVCSREAGHSGPCNGFPRLLEPFKLGVYCRPLIVDYAKATEPAWVTALKNQLKLVTEERDQWRERAEGCSGAVERLATELRAERASHHD